MNYFNEAKTVEDIKYCYRELAMKFHPDRPEGDTEIMQEINQHYQQALQQANGQQSSNSDGKQFTYRYNADIEQAIVEMIDVLLGIKMEGVIISLIGRWVWITGNTRPYKDELKAIGCKYHGKRKCWFWSNDSERSRYNSKDSLVELAEKYGVKSFSQSQPILH
jgi:hypothetical protein